MINFTHHWAVRGVSGSLRQGETVQVSKANGKMQWVTLGPVMDDGMTAMALQALDQSAAQALQTQTRARERVVKSVEHAEASEAARYERKHAALLAKVNSQRADLKMPPFATWAQREQFMDPKLVRLCAAWRDRDGVYPTPESVLAWIDSFPPEARNGLLAPYTQPKPVEPPPETPEAVAASQARLEAWLGPAKK